MSTASETALAHLIAYIHQRVGKEDEFLPEVLRWFQSSNVRRRTTLLRPGEACRY